MTDNRKIEDAWAIISGGRITSVRFSYSVASAEANMKGGQVRKAKIIWLDEPVEPPKQSLPPIPQPSTDSGSLDTASQF